MKMALLALAAITAAYVPALATSCYSEAYDWYSADNRSTFDIALQDFNGDGWQNTVGETKTGDGQRHFFTLKHFPALTITAIRVNGVAVPRADYCFDPYRGWFSLKNAPANDATVAVDYRWSNRLDLFAANEVKSQTDGRDVIYYNIGGTLNRNPGWLSELDNTSGNCVAADFDNDGRIDIAVNDAPTAFNEVINFYKNTGTGLETAPSFSITLPEGALHGMAAGDFNNDGFTDLAIGFDGTSEWFRVYKNNNGTIETSPCWSVNPPGAGMSYDVAWGDIDGDGDLDLACATYAISNDGYVYVYKNNAGIIENSPCWQNAPPAGRCSALAWGDINGDGAIDLVKGINGSSSNLDSYSDIYYSSGGIIPTSPSWESTLYDHARTSWIADCDGDGLGDLLQVESDVQGYFHHDNGALETYPSWQYPPGAPRWLRGLAVGDINNDSYPDVAVGGTTTTGQPTGSPNLVFLNQGNIGITVREFAAAPCARGVALRWETAAAVAGFNLYRMAEGTSKEAKRAPINADLIIGRSPYRFVDANVEAGITYQYWLEAVMPSGANETYGPVECKAGSPPHAFALGQNYPNPARAMTTIVFSLPAAAEASLAIYDLAGRRVATPFRGPAAAGDNVVKIDVSVLPPGVYTYRLEADGTTAAWKMVVAK